MGVTEDGDNVGRLLALPQMTTAMSVVPTGHPSHAFGLDQQSRSWYPGKELDAHCMRPCSVRAPGVMLPRILLARTSPRVYPLMDS